MHPIQIQPREVHLQIFGPVLAGKQQKHICKHKLVSVYLNDYMSSDILIEIQWLLQGVCVCKRIFLEKMFAIQKLLSGLFIAFFGSIVD
jgi:hypothetical protein